MSHEASVHKIQTMILRELLFIPSAHFAQLQKATGIDSDHFKFHIGRLVELNYVDKNDTDYSLTARGKEYANKLDTDNSTIERQPKSAVILVIQNDQDQYLIQERLKHPYYGFWGFPGGKIRWGETIMESAARELMEEAGIEAELMYRGIYHEHVKSDETGEVLEDKIFHIVSGKTKNDSITKQFEGGHNTWMAIEEARKLDKVYKSFKTELLVGIGEQVFIELTQVYTNTEF